MRQLTSNIPIEEALHTAPENILRMGLSPSILAAILVLLSITIYRFFVYPVFLSPLAKIPTAHWSCSFSPLWLLWVRWRGQENRSVYKRHMQSGPAIRLAPNVVSFNCFEDGLKKIYQGGFPKTQLYINGFSIYGTENIFTFNDNATHSSRKRMIANTFSKSFVLSSQTALAATRDVLYGRLLPLIHKAATIECALEVLGLNYSYSMDTFVQWQFGKTLGSNFIEDRGEREMYLKGFFSYYPYLFWMYYFPKLASMLRILGYYIIPESADLAFKAIEDWNLAKCDKAQQLLASGEELSEEDRPIIFEQAMKTMSDVNGPPGAYPERIPIASDMFIHSSAAFETSGNTETYLMWEMCRHPEWQTRLREELVAASSGLRFDPAHRVDIGDLPNPRELDALPVLNAVIMETLRLWPSVPGPQPRVVSKSCKLGGYENIPVGTIVHCSAYSLHNTPEVFPEPHEWRPQRWLEASEAELANMKRWFWAFGSGGRMCIGSNIAYYSMKFLVGPVYRNFTTTIHDTGNMALQDAYLAGPTGHRVELKFHVVTE